MCADDQDTWPGNAVPEDPMMLNASPVARRGTWHETAGSRETTKGMPLPVDSQVALDAQHIDCVPALSNINRSKAAYIQGRVGGHQLDILLDTGASCSAVRSEYMPPKDLDPLRDIRLTNADGRELVPLGTTTMRMNLGNLEADQNFTVVKSLSAPAILGCDSQKGGYSHFQKNIVIFQL